MARDDDNHSNNDNRFARNLDNGHAGTNQRQEPTLSRFDADDDFEEPDRDADYASGYHTGDTDDSDSDLFPEEGTDTSYDAADSYEDEQDEDVPDEDDSDTWDEDDEYTQDSDSRANRWPLSLIAVAVVALVLVAAGGYGVMQQRAATEVELRQLRAKLATSSNPSGDSAARAALEKLQLAHDTLVSEAAELRLEIRTLTDTAAGLEAQLGKQQSTPSTTPSTTMPPTTMPPTTTPSVAQPKAANATVAAPEAKPVAAAAAPAKAPVPAIAKPVESKPVASKPTIAAATAAGPWFVNFGSYATRDMADSWAARLKPGAGKVIVMPITSAGRTLYRLRVVGLADRDSAKQVAHKLETDLRVAELWVGKE